MLWINKLYVWVACLATLFLIASHVFSAWFSQHVAVGGRAFVSFAGGVSVSYVFLDMLPNLVEYNKPIGEYLLANHWLTYFTELSIYIVALIGFLIYYGLDLVAERYQAEKHDNRIAYTLHLVMFCIYNVLITYTMSLRTLAGITYTVLFTFAMALHFVLIDRKFSRMYPKRFRYVGRSILCVALFVGWLVSALFDPVRVLFVAFMTAFLAGSVLLNTFREELPDGDLASFRWFVIGAVLIAMTSLLQAYLHTY